MLRQFYIYCLVLIGLHLLPTGYITTTQIPLFTAVAISEWSLVVAASPLAPAKPESRIVSTRKAKVPDENHITAGDAFAEGERLRAEWSAESLRKAIEKYAAARQYWRSSGDKREEARACKNIGDIYLVLSDYQKAFAYNNESLKLNRNINDRRGEIESLGDISAVYLYLGEKEKALDYCRQAYQLSLEVGDRRGEAQSLTNMGEVYYSSGDMRKSLEVLNRALSLWQESDQRGRAQTLMNIGYASYDLRYMDQALEHYNHALLLWRAANDHRGEALTLTAVGGVHAYLGNKQMALNFHNQAAQLFRTMGDNNGEAVALNGLGYVYENLGEYMKALDCYSRALRLFRMLGNREYENFTIICVGRAYQSLGDNAKALEYYKQLLSRTVNYSQTKANALNSVGKVYDSIGDKGQALDYYQRALRLYRAIEDKLGEASTLNNIGHAYELDGDNDKALAKYTEALSLSQATEDRDGKTTALFNLARVERDLGRFSQARARIEDSLKIIEFLRATVASQELRASYIASVHQHYELYIDLLMRMNGQHPEEGLDLIALQVSERARARSLLDMLADARADIRQGIEPGLLERERSLQQSLNAKAENQMRLLSGEHSDEQAAAIAQEIHDLTTQYDEVEAQIRERSPHYAALTQPQPLNVKEFQQQVLDQTTLLLEYTLGDERSYLWAVSRDGVTSYELPGRAKIEEAARRVYNLLLAHQPLQGETLAERQARVVESDKQYWQQTAALSQVVLGPVAGKLGNKRLLIVADGALQYVPFGALTVFGMAQASEAVGATDPVPLMIDHEIVNLPSASTLLALRRETSQRAPAPKAVAVLADPVFQRDDPRIPASFREQAPAATDHAKGVAKQVAVAELQRDAGGLGVGGNIPRLLASREEAEAIMQVTPTGAGLKAVGFDASRATAMSPELSKYRIVHFATHGVLNSEHPELSGMILSLVDQQGQPQNGFLRLHDIYNLHLPADLVVLSACNTGLGKEVKGEGLIGLTRGFMYAGASGVMASLWKVDDEATAELMKHFYSGMLKDGLPPAAALRQAQVKMLKQKRWRSPYYWAAFVIQGEYRNTIDLDSHARTRGRGIMAAVAVVLAFSIGGGLYAARRRRRRARDTGSD
jgi:CHAT domain-containing protein/Flp pilus assembly protein TadD